MIARNSKSYPTYGLMQAEGVTDPEARRVILGVSRTMFVQCKRGINPAELSSMFVNTLYALSELRAAGRFPCDPAAFVKELATNQHEAAVFHGYLGCERDLDERRFHVVNGLEVPEHGVRPQA